MVQRLIQHAGVALGKVGPAEHEQPPRLPAFAVDDADVVARRNHEGGAMATRHRETQADIPLSRGPLSRGTVQAMLPLRTQL